MEDNNTSNEATTESLPHEAACETETKEDEDEKTDEGRGDRSDSKFLVDGMMINEEGVEGRLPTVRSNPINVKPHQRKHEVEVRDDGIIDFGSEPEVGVGGFVNRSDVEQAIDNPTFLQNLAHFPPMPTLPHPKELVISHCKKFWACVKQNKKMVFTFGFFELMGLLGATVLRDPLETALLWFRDEGTVGKVLFGVSHVIGIMVGAGSTIFEIAGPLILDDTLIVALVLTISKNTAAFIMYWIGWYLGKEWAEKYVHGSDALLVRGFMRAMDDHPTKIVYLWTASYTPSWFRNYMLAALGTGLRLYMVSSFVTGVPYTALWVSVGLSIRTLIEQGEADGIEDDNEEAERAQLIGISVGISFLVIGLAVIAKLTRDAVQKIIAEQREHERQMRITALQSASRQNLRGSFDSSYRTKPDNDHTTAAATNTDASGGDNGTDENEKAVSVSGLAVVGDQGMMNGGSYTGITPDN